MSANDRPNLRDTMRSQMQRGSQQPAPSVKDIMDEGRPDVLDRRTTIYMSTAVWKKMRYLAVDEDTNLSQIIDELCRKRLEDEEN
ncbi:hypothetical protein [Corynebacterium sp. AOP12-C2-36]|uniref:hypothetical protein n=1 Tax=Corynebacterium sp. AOP12-C2-36 TaxID=3457723 RepID=UPI0040346F41